MKLFGSSGIRGIVNRELTPELAMNVGRAVGTLHITAIIGRDTRVSGEMIEHALTSGLLSAGASVTHAGVLPTPTLAYSAKEYDCGIMVTASHNPAQYNGIKLWNSDGSAFTPAQQDELEIMIGQGYSKRSDIMKTTSSDGNCIRRHADMILGNVGKAELTVVVDCGCGAASLITPYVLEKMGCRVITLNSQPDGHFPARDPEPTEESLTQLRSAVPAFGADIGIAHDGDADRMMAVDENGTFISGDRLLLLFGRRECRNSIVVPFDTSMAVDELGVSVTRTRVGDVYVAEGIRKTGAEFGGEPSGAWIFPKVSYCPDGIYAAARIVEIVQDEGRLSTLVSSLPSYPILRGAVACDKKTILPAMQRIKEALAGLGTISELDGVRVEMENGWALVRPSGTEPKIRVTVESRDGVEKLYETIDAVVRRNI
ncbi:MAG TPA: phosphoglucosamine mutase [Candidatus Methanoperedenaceae archaeon]|nr:phosphoglucosamine mutase [Candidatus Methanoperedenaceae archaeon]